MSILSHFRRGWAAMQHKQICPQEEHIDYSILQTKEKYFNYVKENKKDGFGVINHALRWKNYKKCLFVDFRNIEKSEHQISDYLKVNITLKKLKRKSNTFGVDDEVVSFPPPAPSTSSSCSSATASTAFWDSGTFCTLRAKYRESSQRQNSKSSGWEPVAGGGAARVAIDAVYRIERVRPPLRAAAGR